MTDGQTDGLAETISCSACTLLSLPYQGCPRLMTNPRVRHIKAAESLLVSVKMGRIV